MTKYIKILSILVIASIIGYPASAKIIHLNKLSDHLFPGSGSLGFAGCPSGTYLTAPEGAECEDRDKNGCYINCECRVEDGFSYRSDQCKGPVFEPSGDVCDLSKSEGYKYYNNCECADGYVSDEDQSCAGCAYEGFDNVFNLDDARHTAQDAEESSVTCYDPAKFTCVDSNVQMDLTGATIKSTGGLNVKVTYADDPFVYVGIANYPDANENTPNLKICVTSISVKSEFNTVIKSNLPTPPCADGRVKVEPKYGAYYDDINITYNFYTAKPKCTDSCSSTSDADGACVQKSTVDIDYYDTNTKQKEEIHCSKPIGCIKGKISNGHLCIENTYGQADAANIVATTAYTSDKHCVEIDGCKVEEGWEIYGTIATDIRDNINAKVNEATNPSDDPTIYNVVMHEGIRDTNVPDSIGYIICRMATGCNMNYNKPVCDYSNMATEWADFLTGVENF